MARTFDGVDDVIQCSIGALNGVTGFGSIALIVRRVGSAEPVPIAAYQGVSARTAYHFDGGDMYYVTTAGFVTAGFTVDANIWNVAAVTKGTGTVSVRFHQYGYDDGLWQRANSSGTVADGSGSASTIRLGGPGAANPYDGDIAVAAWWKDVVLTDEQIDTLPYSLQAWLALAPTAMWVLDQSATTQTIIDLTGGGANQSSITGTAVSTSSAPFGYGFDALSAVSPAASGDATATPAVIATTAALPQATPQTGSNATATPAVIAATAAVPASARNVSSGPGVVAAIVSMPAWAINTATGPSVTPVVVSLPTPTVQAGGNVTAQPAVVASTASVPQPGVNVAAGPAVLAAVVSLPAAGVNVAASLAAFAAIVSLPQATPDVAGNATVSPSVIAALLGVPGARVNISAGPAVVPAVVALPTALAGSHTAAQPAGIAAVVTVPQTSRNIGTGPAVVALVVTLPELDIFGDVRDIVIVATLAGARWTAVLEED